MAVSCWLVCETMRTVCPLLCVVSRVKTVMRLFRTHVNARKLLGPVAVLRLLRIDLVGPVIIHPAVTALGTPDLSRMGCPAQEGD